MKNVLSLIICSMSILLNTYIYSQAATTATMLLPGIDVSRTEIIQHVPFDPSNNLPELGAVISPDGRLFCYPYEVDVDAGSVWALRIINLAEGSVLTESLVPKEFHFPLGLSESPDGKSIVFTANYADEAIRSLWKTDWSGTPPVRISPRNVEIVQATWHPDGQVIVGLQTIPKSNHSTEDSYRLLFLDPHRPGMILEHHQAPASGWMNYSPDGLWIAYSSSKGVDVINTKTWRTYSIFDPSTLTLSISPEASPPVAVKFNWLQDSQNLLISTLCALNESELNGGMSNKIYKVSLKGQVSYVAEGGLFNQSPDGRSLYLHQDGKDWRLDLTVPRNPKEPISSQLPDITGKMINLADYRGKIVGGISGISGTDYLIRGVKPPLGGRMK